MFPKVTMVSSSITINPFILFPSSVWNVNDDKHLLRIIIHFWFENIEPFIFFLNGVSFKNESFFIHFNKLYIIIDILTKQKQFLLNSLPTIVIVLTSICSVAFVLFSFSYVLKVFESSTHHLFLHFFLYLDSFCNHPSFVSITIDCLGIIFSSCRLINFSVLSFSIWRVTEYSFSFLSLLSFSVLRVIEFSFSFLSLFSFSSCRLIEFSFSLLAFSIWIVLSFSSFLL